MKILRRGPQHGFAIAAQIQQASDEVLEVEAGALYPALHRMTEAGLLKAVWRVSDAGRRARFYELTAPGRRKLERVRLTPGKTQIPAEKSIAVASNQPAITAQGKSVPALPFRVWWSLRNMIRVTMLLVCAAALGAQPAFEVASVKPHVIAEGFVRRAWSARIECPPFHCGIAGMRFTEEAASLADLIMDAYEVRRFQIAGVPSWGDTGRDVYDIAARFPEGQTPKLEMARRMLQTLLADRFQLKLHHETKDLPVYALVVSKGGSKLKRAPEGRTCGGEALEDDPAGAFHKSWDLAPEMLGMFAGRPVIDKTGMSGHYCTADRRDAMSALDMRAMMGGRGGRRGAPETDDSDSAANVFSEVQQKWGLRLEAQKGPADVVVIDHVERPSAN